LAVLAFCAEITRLPSQIVSTDPGVPAVFTTRQTTPCLSTTVAHMLFPRPAPKAEIVLTAVARAAWTAAAFVYPSHFCSQAAAEVATAVPQRIVASSEIDRVVLFI
jgi:hypothetical protein